MIVRHSIALVAMLAVSTLFARAEEPSVGEQVAPDTLLMSIDECIAVALESNPTIHVADMEIRRMDYSRAETLGQLLPSASFGGTYNRTLAKQTMFMNMKGFGSSSSSPDDGGSGESAPAASSGIKVGLDNSYSVGFSASMPLIAPQLWYTLRLSDRQIMESVETARQSRIATICQVKNAYYALLLAEDSRRVIRESYDMAVLTETIYSNQFKVGAASEYDVLRTQVAVKNVEPQLTQAEIAVRRASLQLVVLMGMENVVQIRPKNSLADYESTMYDRVLALGSDISSNADLRLLDIRTSQLDAALKVQKMSFMPTLALTANYNWTSMSNGNALKHFNWNPYSMVGLTLSVPLFEGGQRLNRVRQARVQLEEMKYQRQNLVSTIDMQVSLARDNINLNVKQITSSAESVRQAEKAHDIMQRSFAIGAASYLSLRDSELALTQSRLAYLQSIYDYLTATSELEQLLGSEVPQTTAK